jgi:phospholipid/cholesterol/gamma-HCH transport system ATP-binding protein
MADEQKTDATKIEAPKIEAPPVVETRADGRQPTDVIIRFKDVHKAFGAKVVLNGFDLEVIPGETFAIMGPSGMGKSVTLRHVIGLMKPDKGTVEVEGHDMSTISREELTALRAKMGYVFQEAALLNSLSAGDNVALPLRETTQMPRTRSSSACATSSSSCMSPTPTTRCLRSSPADEEARRLARALINDPRSILYDEPTAGLDPEISASING